MGSLKCVIVSGGQLKCLSRLKEQLKDAGLVIGADRGAGYLKELGVMPHVVLGDMDSISRDDLEYFKNLGVEILMYPAEKDMTDTELAVNYAVERGFKELVILGGAGKRLDHTLANILLLKRIADLGAEGRLVDENNEAALVKDRIGLSGGEMTKVTLLPLTERVEGVTTRGLRYQLNNATLEMGSTLGVSNELSDQGAEVSLTKGLLLVIKSRD